MWGINGSGQLGQGISTGLASSKDPIQVGTLRNWIRLASYGANASAVFAFGS
jgi:hypothetical protein